MMATFQGSLTALITPFHEEGIDEASYIKLIEWQIEQGSHGLVPCGTTGETPTLSHEEHRRLIELCVKTASGRVPVMAGCGSNSTQEAVSLVRYAESVKADGVLVVSPYYNKPSQEGLYQHFKAVAEATALPVYLYNIPGRCVVDIEPHTMARLATLPSIAGVKDASNDMTRVMTIRQDIGAHFSQLSGEDATIVPFLAMGGHGCISVTANVAPQLCAQLHNAWQKKQWQEVERLNALLFPLHKALFVEPNPSPVKYVASCLGLCAPLVRLPLVPIAPETERLLRSLVERLALAS
ncbi:MAG: 4-hydroxy-tetrahydrodipicolinate synthase [Alphaproteobacteria bacterium GM7ARS4]|nr:4-hydroxy-tetrahydrodipicolinate synthase [Alphaproteobacteria bacterium GM7ARS4]